MKSARFTLQKTVFGMVLLICLLATTRAHAARVQFDFTYVVFSPEELRVYADPERAKTKHEPLFARSKVLPTYAASAVTMQSKTQRFPAGWEGLSLKATDNEGYLNTAIRKRRLIRCDTEVLCLVLTLRTGTVSGVQVEFNSEKIDGAMEIYDDDEILGLGGLKGISRAGWKSSTLPPVKLECGDSLICPLYTCEMLEATIPIPEGHSKRWRFARGEMWLPRTIHYVNTSGARGRISPKKAVCRWRNGSEENEYTLENLEILKTIKDRKITPLIQASEGAPPETEWLVTYFSFHQLIKVGTERKRKRENDAFLDLTWIRGAMPEPSDTITPFTLHSVCLKPIGKAALNARVKVKRIRLQKPVRLFEPDGSLAVRDYDSMLTKAGKVTIEVLPLADIAPGSGVNVPLFITRRDSRVSDDGPASQYVVDEVVLPISVIQQSGSHVFESPIRNMLFRPNAISSELDCRG